MGSNKYYILKSKSCDDIYIVEFTEYISNNTEFRGKVLYGRAGDCIIQEKEEEASWFIVKYWNILSIPCEFLQYFLDSFKQGNYNLSNSTIAKWRIAKEQDKL